jgi:hypothetical protein
MGVAVFFPRRHVLFFYFAVILRGRNYGVHMTDMTIPLGMSWTGVTDQNVFHRAE